MAILCKQRFITIVTLVSIFVLLSSIRLTNDNINVNDVMESADKAEDCKNGRHTSVKCRSGGDHEVVMSHQEVMSPPGDDEGLEWMDYSSTRRKSPIHN